MPVVSDKYRGSNKYDAVRRELINRARYKDLMNYLDIAALIGVPASHGSLVASETGHICGEISEDETIDGRPMLSALAVGVSGMPGPGFFRCARKLGRMLPTDDDKSFWERERDAVYREWE